LPYDSHVSIKLYDILGKEVATLVNGYQNAGIYVKEWQTAGLSKGSYICRLSYVSPKGKVEETRSLLKQ
jgi:hypothetical protein